MFLERERPKFNLTAIIIWGVLIVGSGIVFYLYNFAKYGVATDPARFGVFGDYINPFLSLVNIIAVLYLTYHVAHLDDNRNSENIRVQKIIALTQMRMQVSKQLVESIDLELRPKYTYKEICTSLANINIKLVLFRDNDFHLFRELHRVKFVFGSLNPFMLSVEKLINYYVKLGHVDLQEKLYNSDVSELMSDIFEKKDKFFDELNRYIIDQMEKS